MNSVIITGTDPSSKRGGIGCALPGYLSALRCLNISFYCVPTYHPDRFGGSWLIWLKAVPKLYCRIRDIKRSKTNVVVYSHAGAGMSFFREFFVLLVSRTFGAKTIIQLHALEVASYLKSPLKKLLFKLAILPANGLVVLTPWWRDLIYDSGIRKRIYVIPNPLPAEWEEMAHAKRFYPEKTTIRILALSRLVPGKGVDLLVETVPLLPECVEVTIAGDGELRSWLEQRVKILGINRRVHFTGWVSGENKQRLFDNADIFCLPSTNDSFGMGFLEAMANGLPVIALDWGAIGDVVPHGRCGFLIKEAQPELLAEAIQALFSADLRCQMGSEAKEWVLQQFGAEKLGGSLKDIFDSLVCG